MRHIFLSLSIFSCIATTAQSNHSSKKNDKLFIGFNFSPDYGYRTLKDNGGDANANVIIDVRNGIEVGRLGFTTGLNLCMNVTKHVDIETGIQYSNKCYQMKTRDLFGDSVPDPALPARAKLIYNHHYIDIPVKLNLAFGKNRLRFISTAGFAVNFLLNANTKAIEEFANGKTKNETHSTTDDYNKVNISPFIGIGAEYKINDNMNVRIEPTFRYGLVKTVDSPISEHLWNGGLNLTVYYRL